MTNKQYSVRVWISDIVVDAGSALEAEEKAEKMLEDCLTCATVELSEVQSVFEDGKFRPIRTT